MEPFDPDGHVRSALGLHALGALPDDVAIVVDHHLAHCRDCRAEHADMREVTAALALLSREEDRHSGGLPRHRRARRTCGRPPWW